MAASGGSGDEQDLAAAKRTLRVLMLRRRRELPVWQRRHAGLLVARALVADPRVDRAPLLAIHAATRDELPTRPSFEALLPSRGELLFPRVVDGRLEFAPVSDWAELVPGAYGVLAPPADRAGVVLGPDDVVLVPGVAFDEQGGRLGRGGGHYDRTFGVADAPWLVGVAFECQIVPVVPCHSRDCRMDAIVTERGLRRVARAATAGGAPGARTGGT